MILEGFHRRIGRWFASANGRFLLPLLAVLVACGVIAAFAVRVHLEKQLRHQLEERGETLIHATTYAVEVGRTWADVQRMVTFLGGEKDVAAIVVTVTNRRRVAAATRHAWIGRPLDAIPDPALQRIIDSAAAHGTYGHVMDISGGHLRYAEPLMLSPRALDGHPETGTVAVVLRMTTLQTALAEQSLIAFVALAIAMMVIGGLILLVVRRAMLRPLHHLIERIHGAETGDVTAALASAPTEIRELERSIARAFERAREAESRLQAVIRNLPGALYQFRLDEAGRPRFPYLSERFDTLFGLSAHEAQANPSAVYERIHPDDRASLGPPGAIKVGTVWERRFRVLNGEDVRWVLARATARLDENGQYLWDGLVLDITEWKESEERTNFYAALLTLQNDAAPDGFLVVGPDRRVIYSNERFKALWRLPPDLVPDAEVWLEAAAPLIPDFAAFRARIWEVDAVPTLETREEVALTDGRILDCYTRGLFAADGAYIGRAWYYRDITTFRRTEVALRNSNADLEQFAYVASHDLQEPLRMVASYLNLLERRYGDSLNQEARQFMDFAVDGAKRMHSMIKDLLEYSRVERQGHPFQPIATTWALRDALRNLNILIEESDAKVVAGRLPMARGDYAQIVRLFQNLVGNAVKYRHPERRPVVRVQGAETEGRVYFSVSDNGIGIDPQYHDRIFGVFQRLHDRSVGGNGIGLAICRRIVHRHGGTIDLVSRPGAGTTIFFDLPASEATPLPSRNAATPIAGPLEASPPSA